MVKEKHISKYLIFVILGFVILRFPYGTPAIAKIFNAVMILSFVITLFSFSSFKLLKKDSIFLYFLMVFMVLFLLFSSAYNGFVLKREHFIRGMIMPILFINLFTVSLIKDTWGRLKVIDFVLTTFVLVNFVIMILFPNGWFKSELYDLNWFLGFKNVMIRTILPALTINAIIAYHKYGRLNRWNYVYFFICFITIFLSHSSTSLLMIVIYGVCVMGIPLLRKIKYFTLLVAFLIPLIITITIVIYNIQDQYTVFFEKELGKDTTFTGRTFIWEYVILKIFQSPILGYGYHPSLEWNTIYSDFSNFTISHPHNFILYMLIQGGFVYFGMFVFLLIYVTKCTWKDRKEPVICLLNIMYFTFFIGGITESITECLYMFPMMGLFTTIRDSIYNEKIGNHYRLWSL